ncbi:trypsin-like peptidase domain-containing protein [Streptomyces cacaoi]|uniref:VMAP-C domain-containing protein n=1 Tax=Streptomyces cacaoi TaxID=1898 RepID=UPI0011F2A4DE|nr:trypsin-like peptidase domain-containing protein [Streptomyces cacaoi]
MSGLETLVGRATVWLGPHGAQGTSGPAGPAGTGSPAGVGTAGSAAGAGSGAGAGGGLWGSGFCVAPGWVLTCAHVLHGPSGDPADRLGADGTRTFLVHGEYGTAAARAGYWIVDDENGGPEQDLALVRLVTPFPDSREPACVWLTDRGDRPVRVCAYGWLAAPGRPPRRWSGRCAVSGADGAHGTLLGPDTEIPHGASGGPVLDPDRGAVVGIVKARRRNRDGGLAIGTTALRGLSHAVPVGDHQLLGPDPYQALIRAHDRWHDPRGRAPGRRGRGSGAARGRARARARDAGGRSGRGGPGAGSRGAWAAAQEALLTGGRGTPGGWGPRDRLTALALLAELPCPEAAADVEDHVAEVLGEEPLWDPASAPRDWRDGHGWLYETADGDEVAFLHYLLSVAATCHASSPGSADALLDWAGERADALPQAQRALLNRVLDLVRDAEHAGHAERAEYAEHTEYAEYAGPSGYARHPERPGYAEHADHAEHVEYVEHAGPVETAATAATADLAETAETAEHTAGERRSGGRSASGPGPATYPHEAARTGYPAHPAHPGQPGRGDRFPDPAYPEALPAQHGPARPVLPGAPVGPYAAPVPVAVREADVRDGGPVVAVELEPALYGGYGGHGAGEGHEAVRFYWRVWTWTGTPDSLRAGERLETGQGATRQELPLQLARPLREAFARTDTATRHARLELAVPPEHFDIDVHLWRPALVGSGLRPDPQDRLFGVHRQVVVRDLSRAGGPPDGAPRPGEHTWGKRWHATLRGALEALALPPAPPASAEPGTTPYGEHPYGDEAFGGAAFADDPYGGGSHGVGPHVGPHVEPDVGPDGAVFGDETRGEGGEDPYGEPFGGGSGAGQGHEHGRWRGHAERLAGAPAHAVPVLCRAGPGGDAALREVVRAGYGLALWSAPRRHPEACAADGCRELLARAAELVREARHAGALPEQLRVLRERISLGDRTADWAEHLVLLYDDPRRPVPGPGPADTLDSP